VECKIAMRVDFAPAACSAQTREDARLGRTSVVSVPADINKDFVISAGNSLQVLLCLSNLMSAHADDPAKVRVYAHLLEQRLQAFGKLICPMFWSAT
jgi:hypothetical protein